MVLDLLGIFVFALTGALVAVRKELDVFAVLVLAGAAGLGGGFTRDVLTDRVPLVFRGELYATPALVGAAIAVLGEQAGLRTAAVAAPAAAVCFGWRVLAVRRGWDAPRATGSAST